MNRYTTMGYLMTAAVASLPFFVEHQAHAQTFQCGSPLSPSGQVCLQSNTSSGIFGIESYSTAQVALYAKDTSSGIGVYGISSSGYGVLGQSDSSFGVYGTSDGDVGVYGFSSSADGTWGVTEGSGMSGVTGINTAGVGNGLYGVVTSNNSVTYGAGSYAVNANGNLLVQGTPYSAGSTTFTVSSDIRLKTNVQPLSGSLDTLLKLRGVTFEWKNPSEHDDHRGLQRGFIAQEVEKVIPEWVGVDGKGFKNLNLTGLEPMVVESLRTLKLENDDLRARVRTLEARSTGATVSGFGAGGLLSAACFAMMAAMFIVNRKRGGVDKSQPRL
jgi:hypothetical protein